MDVCCRKLKMVDERGFRHTVIALRIGSGNETFVSPEQMYFAPLDLRAPLIRGKQFIQTLGRASSCEHQREASTASDGRSRRVGNQFRRTFKEVLLFRGNVDGSSVHLWRLSND